MPSTLFVARRTDSWPSPSSTDSGPADSRSTGSLLADPLRADSRRADSLRADSLRADCWPAGASSADSGLTTTRPSDAQRFLARSVEPPAAPIVVTAPKQVDSGAQILAFRRHGQGSEAQVVRALAGVAARRSEAAGDLFDLINKPLYALILAITKDPASAQHATIATFVEIWRTSGQRPDGAGTAWTLDIACRCARAGLVRTAGPTPALRLVPPI